MGEMMKLPKLMAKLSPFGHIPELPIEGRDLLEMAIMTVIAIALIVTGFIGYRKRDIEG